MAERSGWLKGTWSILVRPTPRTFRELAWGRQGVFGSAVAWLAGISGLVFLVLGISGYWEGFWLGQLVLGTVLVPLWLLLFVYLQHYLAARLFRASRDQYEGLLLSSSLILGLTMILNLLAYLLSLPFWLSSPLVWIYGAGLVVLSLMGVDGLSWWQAVLVALFSGVLSLGGLILGALVLISLLWTVPEFF